MRWQSLARLAIALFVLVFAGFVYVALRRQPAPKVHPETPRVDQKTVVELGPLKQRRTDSEGNLTFELTAQSDFIYPDGRHLLKEAELTLPDRNGRTMIVSGGEMEVIVPTGTDKQLQTATMTKGAKLRTSDGLEITSQQAIYDERTGMLNVPGDVQFTKGRLSGSGVGASYDKGRNVIWLLDKAHVTVKPDEKGQGALEATAKAFGMARNDHYLKLTEGAHVVGEGRTLDATELTVQMTPDDKLIQSMALRGNSRITGSPGASGAQGMSARDIDLVYAADGRTIQHSHLVENAVVQLGGGAGDRRIAAKTIDLTMSADGSTVIGLNAVDNVQVDLPASADAPAKRITSATLNGGGPNGLQTATFAGTVSYREMRAARRGGPAASERTARSQQLVVQTQPGLGAVERADFRGNVHIVDGDTTADGQRAVHQAAQDTFELTFSPGDPGPPPSVNDGRILVNARTITVGITSKKLKADTDVRSSVQPSRGQEPAKGPSAAPAAPGQGNRPAEGGRTPSIMKQDQPVNVTSKQLDYDGAAGVATYTGAARLWQDQTQIQGDTIVVDDRSGNLTSRGHVSSVMFFDETDSKTQKKQPVQTIATADQLVYDDAKRLATYTSGPTAKAHMVGTQGDVTAEQIQLFLKPGGGEIDRAEADRSVVVKENIRTVIGQHLVYTPADQTYVMTGAPVEIEEKKTANECSVSYATEVTFRRDAESTIMKNNLVAPVKLRQCGSK